MASLTLEMYTSMQDGW